MQRILIALTVLILVASSGNATAQQLDWARSMGAAGTLSAVKAIKADPLGNVIAVGTFNGPVDFDPGSAETILTPVATEDVFIQKLNADGGLLWVKSLSCSFNWGMPVSVDDLGNIYLTGGFSGSIDLDPGAGTFPVSSDDYSDFFVLKLDPNGDLIWAKIIDNPTNTNSSEGGVAVITDAAYNVYAVGTYGTISEIDFDPGAGVFNLPVTSNGAVVKLDVNGDFVWASPYGGMQSIFPVNLGLGVDNSILITGGFAYNQDFDPGPGDLTIGDPSGATSTFVVKMSTSGAFVWAKAMVPLTNVINNFQLSGSVISDSEGNIYVASQSTETIDLDPDPVNEFILVPPAGDLSGFVEKLDANGNFIWANSYSAYMTGLTGLGYDGTSLYTMGRFDLAMDVSYSGGPSENFVSLGQQDIYLEKLDVSNGNYQWRTTIGGTGNDIGLAMDGHMPGVMLIAGGFTETIDFDFNAGETNLTAMSSVRDAFIARITNFSCDTMLALIDSVHDVSCTANGELFASGTGGVGPYSFNWDNDPLEVNAVLSTTAAGIHLVEVTDAFGCTQQIEVMLNGSGSQSAPDLNANLLTTDFRPGYETTISLDGFNAACAPATGQLKLVCDTLVDFLSAIPAVSAISGDTLIWDFANLAYDSAHLTPQITFTTSVLAAIGDTVDFTLIITPFSGDADTINNVKTYAFPVVNGYDPNVKFVYPIGKCDVGYIEPNQTLTYTIQFQNTGNSEAINIAVVDSLDTDLDLNTVRVVGKSHELWTEVLPGNVLKFHFDNIHLPDSTSDETASHGYVIFEVRPVTSWLNHNTEIGNEADIYFDFNPAITTNEVQNLIYQGDDLETFSCSEAGIDETGQEDMLIYPNPTTGIFTLSFETEIQNATIRINDLQGKEILRKTGLNGKQSAIDLSGANSGIYLVTISTPAGTTQLRISKL